MKRKLNICLLIICICMLLVMQATAVYTPYPTTRSDGVWLFPLSSGYWNSFSDWAGCNWDGYTNQCPFHSSGCNISCGAIHKYGDIGHNGVDISAGSGTSVMAAADGVLYTTGKNTAQYRGIIVVIEHKIVGTEWSYYSFYQHLSSAESSLNGQNVSAGQTIGKVGNSDGGVGAGYGNHLHFGIVLGYSGHGSEMAASPDGSSYGIGYLQRKGWILDTSGYREGMILVNPAENIPLVDGYSDSLQRHPGTITYTFDPNAVSISTHIHNYSIEAYEAAHPHRCYKKCACGDFYYTGETVQLGDCAQCISESEFSVQFLNADGSVFALKTAKAGNYAIPAEYPKLSGSYFSGWKYEKGDTLADVQPGNTVQIQGEVTFYPVFVTHAEAISGSPVEIYNIDDFTDSRYVSTCTSYSRNAKEDISSWSDWSEYGTDEITASRTVRVKSASVYRYYYVLCNGCGDHNPLTAKCGCGSSSWEWVQVWKPIPYSDSNSSVVSYATYKRQTTSLGDGELYYFSSGNLNDTEVGTADSDSSDIVIKVGYSCSNYVPAYRTKTITINRYTLTPAVETPDLTFSEMFPDSVFQDYVLSTVLKDSSDPKTASSKPTAAQMSMIESCKSISLPAGLSRARSLKGIEYFTALESLNCKGHYIRELDLRQNTKLTYVHCGSNQITKLDVSSCPELKTLDCGSNRVLAELDVRKNVKLDYLNCRGNSLKQLDLSSNVNLTYLSCFKNNLTELDLSKNAKLSVASPSIDEQAITDTKAVLKRSGNGYVLNMNELVPGIDLTRVTMNDGGVLDTGTGIVTYTEKPDTVKYKYATHSKDDTKMSVSWTPVFEQTVLLGDLNGDGELTSVDVVLLARYLAGAEALTEAQLTAADLNADGVITSADLVLLARKVAGLE